MKSTLPPDKERPQTVRRTKKTLPDRDAGVRIPVAENVESCRAPELEMEVLDQARMQWQFGDWENLAALDMRTIEQHPKRAMLALLVGAAYQQLNDHSTARRYVGWAREWGCDKQTITRVLIAGAYNTLGRIAAVSREDARALKHFRAAVDGVGGDARLACQARSISEIARLDLVDQAVRVMKLQRKSSPNEKQNYLDGWNPDRAPLALSNGHVESDMQGNPPALLGNAHGVEFTKEVVRPGFLGSRGAIVIAGMRHSGSTALFNVVRLALEQRGISFKSLYSEGVHSELLHDPDCQLLLIKTHEFRDDVVARANLVITTRRDLRDTVASAKRRKFPLFQQLKGAVEYAKYNRTLHDVWSPHSDYEFVYETYMKTPLAETSRLLCFIGLGEIDAAAIHDKVSTLPDNDYETSLLSPTHITDPGRVMSFHDNLDEAEVGTISIEHAAWLRRFGYEVQ